VPLTCAINLSEGRDPSALRELAAAAGRALLDLHADTEHHRSVLTLIGDEDALHRLLSVALGRLCLDDHAGVHPRLGVVDVVPFVPLVLGASRDDLARARLDEAVAARDALAAWVADTFAVPCFLYGPEIGGGTRTLPDIRRHAFADLAPDLGPRAPHPSAGAVCVGARRALVAYNVLLATSDLALGRKIAADLRSPEVRCLAFPLAAGVQISANLVAPWSVGPATFADAVARRAAAANVTLCGSELVGLLPRAVLDDVPAERWDALDLAPERTLEARLAGVGA
jgi:glutamate formiminotransferase